MKRNRVVPFIYELWEKYRGGLKIIGTLICE